MFTVNINNQIFTSDRDMKLLPFLRDVLHYTGTKDGCSEGACGACTVIVDGRTARACVLKLSKLEGKKVVTIEGLSKREQEVYSYCFAQAGAVQCGFCIPGMIMSAKALLDVNLEPTREDVKKAIRGNICRCTGYIKIEDAILMAADYFRNDRPVDWDSEEGRIGQRMRRVDAVEKALGEGKYTDDIHIEGMVYGKCVRSRYPRARIVRIDTTRAEADERCIKVLTAHDVPLNEHGHLIKDWPVFIQEGKITHYIGDAICMVVSEDQDALDELCSLVDIEYEELEGVYTAQDSLRERGRINVHHDRDNLMYDLTLERGDVDRAIRESDFTVTYDFHTPHTEHAFMETECAVGCYDESTKGVIVYTSSQSIFDEQREISHLLRLDIQQVRCVSMFVGGGFGGKEDMSVQHHAALAAYILQRPVKVKLTRQESLNIHPKRHPMDMHVVIGCDKNGIIKGSTIDIIADTGAYASLGGPVLQRACTHAAGPYNYQNIRITGKALYTNNVPCGAFRGFGVTQSCFAFECALNMLSEKVGLDPFEIRYRNAIKPGDIMPNGQIASGDTGLKECLDAVKEAYYSNPKNGIACALKNSGLGVGVPDTGRCTISIEEGKVHVRTSAACMGQGLATVALMITVEATGLRPEDIIVEHPDTSRTPNSGTSTASRQTAFTGEAVKRAALALGEALKSVSLSELEGQEFKGEFTYSTDALYSQKKNPISHLAYSYSAQVVELDEAGKVKKVTAACDAGTVINMTSIEGQVEGGVVMGLGYALTENFISDEGYVKSKYGTLGLLRAPDAPPIEVTLVHGPKKGFAAYGAKGIGELCTIPTAPAVQNAYYKRDGIFRTSLPLEKTAYKK